MWDFFWVKMFDVLSIIIIIYVACLVIISTMTTCQNGPYAEQTRYVFVIDWLL